MSQIQRLIVTPELLVQLLSRDQPARTVSNQLPTDAIIVGGRFKCGRDPSQDGYFEGINTIELDIESAEFTDNTPDPLEPLQHKELVPSSVQFPLTPPTQEMIDDAAVVSPRYTRDFIHLASMDELPPGSRVSGCTAPWKGES